MKKTHGVSRWLIWKLSDNDGYLRRWELRHALLWLRRSRRNWDKVDALKRMRQLIDETDDTSLLIVCTVCGGADTLYDEGEEWEGEDNYLCGDCASDIESNDFSRFTESQLDTIDAMWTDATEETRRRWHQICETREEHRLTDACVDERYGEKTRTGRKK